MSSLMRSLMRSLVRSLGVLALLTAIGCYAPSYPVGLRCSDNNTCPPGQGCNRDGICLPTASIDAAAIGGMSGSGGASGAGGTAGRGGASGAGGTAGRGGAGAGGTGNSGGAGLDGGAGDGASTVDAGPRCGDHRIDRGEECDDGNTMSGDGCDPQCQVEGLLGHWPLAAQYMSGDTAPDLVSPGHPGAIVAVGDNITGLVPNRFGTPASALSITGSDWISDIYAYVKMTGLTSLPPPLTMTIWVDRQGGNGTGLVMGIDQGPQLYEEGTAITARVPSGTNNYTGTTDVPLTQRQWTFLAAVFEQAGGSWKISLYVDGETSVTDGGMPATDGGAPVTSSPPIASVAPIGNFNVGGLYGSCSNGEQVCNSGFVGYLNDARLYGRALSAAEVNDLFAFVPTP